MLNLFMLNWNFLMWNCNFSISLCWMEIYWYKIISIFICKIGVWSCRNEICIIQIKWKFFNSELKFFKNGNFSRMEISQKWKFFNVKLKFFNVKLKFFNAELKFFNAELKFFNSKLKFFNNRNLLIYNGNFSILQWNFSRMEIS